MDYFTETQEYDPKKVNFIYFWRLIHRSISDNFIAKITKNRHFLQEKLKNHKKSLADWLKRSIIAF